MMSQKYGVYLLYLVSACFLLASGESLDGEKSTAVCGELGDCPSVEANCEGEGKCGCDKTMPTIYDNTTQRCEIDIKKLLLSLTEKYNNEGSDMSMENDLATKLRAEADRIFQGIIVAALIFISCASICVLMACIYCCRINYTDYQLKKSIKELAKKVGANPKLRRPTVKSPAKPISESCNVVVEEAGVFCV